MAKSILVDFRGGLNNKISGHMIGETQGQDMQDVDLSLVRLDGREQINDGEVALGSFFYEPGNLADALFTGRWVSIYAADDDGTSNTPYLPYSQDFAVWNKDLYVAFGPGHSDGQVRVYRDGATAAEIIDFAAPGTSSVTTVNATATSETLSTAETLVNLVTGQSGTNPQTVTVTTANASQFSPAYQQGGYNGPRGRWEWSNGTTYYQNTTPTTSGGSVYTIQQATGGSAGQTYSLSLATISYFSPPYQLGELNNTSNTTFSDTRTGTGIDSTTFSIYRRESPVNANYYVASATSATLNVSANSFYTKSGTGTSTTTNTENISYYWDRNKLSDYPYSASNTNEMWQQFVVGSNQYLTIVVGGSNYLLLGGAYASTSGRAGMYQPSSYSFLNVTLSNGDLYQKQSSGEFLKSGTSSTYLANADVMDIVHVRAAGVSGNTMGITTTTKQYFRTSNNYAAINSQSSGYYYDFADMDDNYGRGEWRDQQQNVLHSIANIIADSSASFTSGGWTYNIPIASVTPSYRNPPNTSRTGKTIQAFYYPTTRTQTVTQNVNYTYTLHTNSVTTNSTYTYSDITDTIPGTSTIPDTPAFTYDDARAKLYLEYASTNDVGAEPEDNARGANWLAQNRAFSLTDHGYYLRTVRESTNLPQLSADYTKATLATNNTFVLDSSYSFVNTPQRLNFTVALPSDHNTTDSNGNTLNSVTPLVGFKLERRDNTATVDLGYIAPEAVFASLESRTAVGFSYSTSNNQVTLSNLEATGQYRLKFQAYQDTYVQVGSNASAKSNTTGVSWGDGSTTGASAAPTITLIAQTATTPDPDAGKRYLAADFWLEKKIILGANASSDSDDVYATIRCFDVFDRNGNAVNSGVIAGTSDYLDVFATGTSSGSGLSTTSQTGVPDYLIMLEEANNFFFAVGSDDTNPNRYGTTAVNKSDSFLFVSEYNNPRNWPLTGYVEFEGSITGIHGYPGELIVWTSFGVYRVTGSRYDQMRKSRLATTEGLPKGQHRTIAQVGQYLVWVSQSGICAYNGEAVMNITRGRLGNLDLGTGDQLHAAQFEDIYYVVDDTETGYAVDFSLTGFPITRIDLKEGATGGIQNTDLSPAQTRPPVLVYRSAVNQLYSRRGVIQGSSTRIPFTYKTREFDGGAYGSLKLVRNITVNGTGNGTVQIYLDGKAVFYNTATPPVATPVSVAIESGTRSEPARVYLPTTNTANTMYGLPVADTWSVELSWNGQIDWIDTEYEVLST